MKENKKVTMLHKIKIKRKEVTKNVNPIGYNWLHLIDSHFAFGHCSKIGYNYFIECLLSGKHFGSKGLFQQTLTRDHYFWSHS